MTKKTQTLLCLALLFVNLMGMVSGINFMENGALATQIRCREVTDIEQQAALNEMNHTEDLKVCIDNNITRDLQAYGAYYSTLNLIKIVDFAPDTMDKTYVTTHEYVHHLQKLMKNKGISYEGLPESHELLADYITYRLLEIKFDYGYPELSEARFCYAYYEEITNYFYDSEEGNATVAYINAVIDFEMNL